MTRTVALFAGVLCGASLAWAQSEDFGAWKTLFNGKDTAGWVCAKDHGRRGVKAGDAPERWIVVDGALTNGSSRVYDICTADQFDNYELELQYKVPAGGNSGVYLRGQIEIQISDTRGKPAEQMRPGDAGGIYSKIAPIANPQKPAGQWNTFRIRHLGHRITVWHNGVLAQDNQYVDSRTGGPMTKDPSTGKPLDLTKGPIMLQGDHSLIHYKNIRIRPLCTGEGWRPIWNGKDLSAFTVRSGKVQDYWRIDNHAVTNQGKRRDMWTKEKFGNFLVHYEYKSDPASGHGNSGFYLRDQWEIQIHMNPGGKHGDCALYSIYEPSQKMPKMANNWKHMDVKLDDMKIWVWQNGTLLHDGVVCKRRTDSGTATLTWSTGPFKFQGDHGDVWFTNMYIKPLPPTQAK